MIQDPILLLLVVLPLIGALCCLAVSERITKWVALGFSIVGFGLGVYLYSRFQGDQPFAFEMIFTLPWIRSYQVQFALGVDALSLPLVALTKFMIPIAILASWKETRWPRAFMFAFLVLDCSMTGTFLAIDIFAFYIFWEMMLIPMVLIIGIWGAKERIYAALKFFLFTFAGSVLMLVAIFYLFSLHQEQFGYYTGEIQAFYRLTLPNTALFWGISPQALIFLAFFFAFAIKVPLFPLHTWLPDAHVQAPTGGSILLAAVLLKMGTYGLLRFCIPITPEAFSQFTPFIVTLSLIGILYGAWVAYHQSDIKKLIAYSSVSHLGFVVLGICAANSIALTGAMLQMVNHGISTGGLFLLAGILYDRRHSKQFEDYGGLAKQMPWFAFFLVLVACSSMAVPGLNGFVGEFLILLGTFQTNAIWASIAVLGVIFAAIYILIMLRKTLFGPLNSEENKKLKDLEIQDWLALLPLCILIVWLGVYPQFFLEKLKPSYDTYWSVVTNGEPQPPSEDTVLEGYLKPGETAPDESPSIDMIPDELLPDDFRDSTGEGQ